jgi:hypothetical protein
MGKTRSSGKYERGGKYSRRVDKREKPWEK